MSTTNPDQAILDAYEKWDPNETFLQDFLYEIGMSRSALYAVLRKHHVTPKSKRGAGSSSLDDKLNQIIERLDRLEAHIKEYMP